MIRNFSLLVHVLVLVYSGIDMGRQLFVNYNLVLRPDKRNSQQKVMARYGISGELSGIVSPVNLDIEYFNLGMMYQNGIFIIMDPGYYRMNLHCYHN